MGKKIIPKLFTKDVLNKEIPEHVIKLLGPLENFHDVESIQHMNVRIRRPGNKLLSNLIYSQNMVFNFGVNKYVKYLLRLYCNGIFTTDNLIERNKEDLEVDYQAINVDRDIYLKGGKKVGIVSKDIKLNVIKGHPVFNNFHFVKHIYTRQDKYDRLIQTYPDILSQLKEKLVTIYPQTSLEDFSYLFKQFKEVSGAEVTLIEGSEEYTLSQIVDTEKLSDVLVITFVKDGKVITYNF
jgi:hypothetical protein